MPSSISITGNLCADPELSETAKGSTMARVRIADDSYGRDPIFWSCTAWNEKTKIFESAKKGSLMVITGSLEPWKDDTDKVRQPGVRIDSANYVGGKKKKDDGLPF